MLLRPRQKAFVERSLAALDIHRNTLGIAPTAAGKTIMLSAVAGEMIGELSLAITSGLGLSAIGRTIHPYPTQAEVIKKLADAHNRTRLTWVVKKLLAGWLKWRRR